MGLYLLSKWHSNPYILYFPMLVRNGEGGGGGGGGGGG